MTERVLALLAKNGNNEALEELISIYYQKLYAYFQYRDVSAETSQDLTQETFIKLIKSIRKYQARAAFSTYIYVIANSVFIDYCRKRKEIQLVDEATFDKIESQNNNDAIRYILEELDEIEQLYIIYYFYQGLTYREIATITETPVSTIKTRVKKALEKCRKMLEDIEDET